MTALNGVVQHFSTPIDGFIKFIFGACRIVAKETAHLRARLWREEQRDTRTD
jgi:hypothetical protein